MTLRKALLWAYFDAEAQYLVPLQIIKRVHSDYEAIQKLDITLNPVCKVPLVVCGHKGQLIIEELFDEEAPTAETPAYDDNNSPATPEVLNRRQSRHLSDMQAVFTQLMLIRKQNEELTTEIQNVQAYFSKKIVYLGSTVNRLRLQFQPLRLILFFLFLMLLTILLCCPLLSLKTIFQTNKTKSRDHQACTHFGMSLNWALEGFHANGNVHDDNDGNDGNDGNNVNDG